MDRVELTISAGRDHVSEPWIWKLGHDFNIVVNVIKANIDTDYGWLQVNLEGSIEEIQRATAWLMTTGMNIEAKQRAVGA